MEKEKCVIKVYDLTTDMAVEYGNGDALCNLIKSKIHQQKNVVVDFSGVNIVLSAFLNAAIGNLFHDMSKEEFDKTIQIIGLPPFSENILKRVIDGAVKKYSQSN